MKKKEKTKIETLGLSFYERPAVIIHVLCSEGCLCEVSSFHGTSEEPFDDGGGFVHDLSSDSGEEPFGDGGGFTTSMSLTGGTGGALSSPRPSMLEGFGETGF